MGLFKIQPALEQSPPSSGETKGPLGLQKTTKNRPSGVRTTDQINQDKEFIEWYWQGSGSYHWQVPPLRA
jgi:hypothetical protein